MPLEWSCSRSLGRLASSTQEFSGRAGWPVSGRPVRDCVWASEYGAKQLNITRVKVESGIPGMAWVMARVMFNCLAPCDHHFLLSTFTPTQFGTLRESCLRADLAFGAPQPQPRPQPQQHHHHDGDPTPAEQASWMARRLPTGIITADEVLC